MMDGGSVRRDCYLPSIPFIRFTWSTKALKLKGSVIASSDRTLRLSRMLDWDSEFMKAA